MSLSQYSAKITKTNRRLNNSHDQTVPETNDAFSRNEVISVRETLKIDTTNKMTSYYQPRQAKVPIDKDNSEMRIEILCLQKEKNQKDKEIQRLLAENEHLFQIAVVQNEKFKKMKLKQMSDQQMENGMLNSQVREQREQIAQSDRLIQAQKNQLNNYLVGNPGFTQQSVQSKPSISSAFELVYDDDSKKVNQNDIMENNILLEQQLQKTREMVMQLEFQLQTPDEEKATLKEIVKSLKQQLQEEKLKLDYQNQVSQESYNALVKDWQQIQGENDELIETYEKNQVILAMSQQKNIQFQQEIVKLEADRIFLKLEKDELIKKTEVLINEKQILKNETEKHIQEKLVLKQQSESPIVQKGVQPGREIVYDIEDGIVKRISFEPLQVKITQESKLRVKSQLSKKISIKYVDLFVNCQSKIIKVLLASLDGQIIGYPDTTPSNEPKVRIEMESSDIEIINMEFLDKTFIREYRLTETYPNQTSSKESLQTKDNKATMSQKEQKNLKRGDENKNEFLENLDYYQVIPVSEVFVSHIQQFMQKHVDNLISVSDLQFIRGAIPKNKKQISITLKGLIVHSSGEFIYGIQGIYLIKQKKSNTLRGGEVMLASPCLDQREYEQNKDQMTIAHQNKIYDLENNELDYISVYKDTNGIIKNLQIKMKGSTFVMVHGSVLQIKNLKQSYIRFEQNQYLSCDFKFPLGTSTMINSIDSKNTSDFVLSNIRAISF